MSDRLISFLAGDGRDDAGRAFDDVLALPDADLEARHDFIQWLFPLTEPSRAVPGSPWLEATALAALRDSPLAVERQARAAARMLGFYRATSNWRGRFDHNQLRITRIIKSLRLVSGDAAADAFKAQILALAQGSPINAEALAFWREA
jgi:hypothetical protein